MGTPVSWTSALRVNWHPILTFERRRMELLDWYEEHIAPSAFRDTPEVVGIAFDAMSTQIEVRRESLVIKLGASQEISEDVQRAISGALEVMMPRHPAVEAFRSVWSVSLEEDYESLRSAFAKRVVPVGKSAISEFSPLDAAILADVDVGFEVCQLEFGIVDSDELSERLGRGSGARAGVLAAEDVLGVDVLPVSLPRTSLFGEVLVSDRSASRFASAQELLDLHETYMSRITTLLRDLAAGVG